MPFSAHLKNRVFIIVFLNLLIGCTTTPLIGRLPLIENVKDRIANIALPIQLSATTDIKNINHTRFNTCMAPLSAKLKPGFINMIHSIKNQTTGADEQLFGKINDIGDENFLLNDQDLHPVINHLFDKILNEVNVDSSRLNANGKLAEINSKFMERFKSNPEILKAETQEATLRAKDYLTAYFTKGTVQTVTQTLQDKHLTEQLAIILKRKADDPAIVKALDLIDSQLSKTSANITHHGSGFIAGDGTQYGFPGNQYENTAAIDHNQIGADIIRILLEALRDTYAPLPVFDGSTAIQTKNVNKLDAYKLEFDDAGTAKIAWNFDRHDPQKIAQIILTTDEFQQIEAHARQAEAFVASNVGKVIRGGSWGSLNNEAVAKLVETTAGVIARHVTERAEWCVHTQLGTAKDNSPSSHLE